MTRRFNFYMTIWPIMRNGKGNERMDTIGKFKVGSFVRLTADARVNRDERMRKWEGVVEGFNTFWYKDDQGKRQTTHWIVVDWGVRMEDKGNFVWSERPEDLAVS